MTFVPVGPRSDEAARLVEEDRRPSGGASQPACRSRSFPLAWAVEQPASSMPFTKEPLFLPCNPLYGRSARHRGNICGSGRRRGHEIDKHSSSEMSGERVDRQVPPCSDGSGRSGYRPCVAEGVVLLHAVSGSLARGRRHGPLERARDGREAAATPATNHAGR